MNVARCPCCMQLRQTEQGEVILFVLKLMQGSPNTHSDVDCAALVDIVIVHRICPLQQSMDSVIYSHDGASAVVQTTRQDSNQASNHGMSCHWL